jgi:hypothetical protein
MRTRVQAYTDILTTAGDTYAAVIDRHYMTITFYTLSWTTFPGICERSWYELTS